MLNLLETHLKNAVFFNKNTPLLLACSGGKDSMALLHGLLNCGFSHVEIAHANFQLRGEESDGDEKFVSDFCNSKGIIFHTISFETALKAKSEGVSTQMAARTLRYEWLEQLRKDRKLDLILTAHHANDQVETVLMNLVHGTGIRGLKGMEAKNGYVVRPLLGLKSVEILEYIQQNQIKYREDSSNESDKYKRNFIRHQIIPGMEQLNPNLMDEMLAFSQRMKEVETLFLVQVDKMKSRALKPWKNGHILHFIFLQIHSSFKTILFEILKDFDCSQDQVAEVMAVIGGEKKENASGQTFFTATHRLILDKKTLYILPLISERTELLSWTALPHQIVFNEYKIDVRRQPIAEVNAKRNERYVYFDADLIEMPLSVRYPKIGDYFYPLGLGKAMNSEKAGKKKLSKYFKDIKLPLAEREQTPVLFSGEKLIWVIGHRLDDRFKITPRTQNVICMVITKN